MDRKNHVRGSSFQNSTRGSGTYFKKHAAKVLRESVDDKYCRKNPASRYGFCWQILAVHTGHLTSGGAFVTPLNPQLPHKSVNAFVLSSRRGLEIHHEIAAAINATHPVQSSTVAMEPSAAEVDESEQIGGREWLALLRVVLSKAASLLYSDASADGSGPSTSDGSANRSNPTSDSSAPSSYQNDILNDR